MKLGLQHFKIINPLSQIIKPTTKQLSTARVNALLLNVPRVQISDGKNNYLLLMIHLHGKTRYGRTIVRGTGSKTHEEIFAEVLDEMDDIGICTKSLGGGFIDNKEKKKKIKIYGCCKTYGEAPHGRTKDILLAWTKFKDFEINVAKYKK
ncbi:hypothetical protein KR074_005338 [Drosophila pseudoananassae]|nr:hypothetical protein KR074_005338 [Drosophila pseudoananassae]